MKQTFLMLTVILITLNVYSQSTKSKLKLVTKTRGINTKTIEKYQIDKKKHRARNGTYEKYIGDVLVQSGFYENNLKDSLWVDYSLNGQLVAKGRYLKDIKIGVWYYLSFRGDTIQIYNHTDNIMLFYDIIKENVLFPKNKKNRNATLSDFDSLGVPITYKLPIYIGGETMISHIFTTNLSFPVKAHENGTQGVVYVSFTIDKEGGLSKVYAKNRIGDGLEEEAVRLVKLLDKWVPGEHKGKRINVPYSIPLTFGYE